MDADEVTEKIYRASATSRSPKKKSSTVSSILNCIYGTLNHWLSLQPPVGHGVRLFKGVTAMSDVSTTTTTIAPSHPAGRGGHMAAFRAQEAFALDAKLVLLGGNPWRDGSPGHRFYEQVLAKKPSTVGKAIELAAALAEPFAAKAVQGHLRWMFTMAGAFLEIDGQRHPASLVEPKKAKAAEPKAGKPKVANAPNAKKAKKAKAAEPAAATA
jgi:hypothetical protein